MAPHIALSVFNPEFSSSKQLRMLPVAVIFVVVSALFAIGKVESDTYYIKPHENSLCPAEPCMTLTDYTIQSKLTTITSLEYLAGTHTLDQSVSVEGSVHYMPWLETLLLCHN